LAEDAGGARVSAKRHPNKNASGTPKKQKTTKDGKGKQVAKESDDEGGSELDGNVAQEMQASDHAGQEEMLGPLSRRKKTQVYYLITDSALFCSLTTGRFYCRSRHPLKRC